MKSKMFSALYLKPSMEQPGCPICSLRALYEKQYLENLLHEYVNDYQSQAHFIASLGYCPEHAWQMAKLEQDKFGDGLGNSLIYQNLVNVCLKTLADFKEISMKQKKPEAKPGGFSRWLKNNDEKKPDEKRDPFSSHNQKLCRVCQIGKSAEKSYLEWLLENLSDPEPAFREQYTRSDGLCMYHFRQALAMQTPEVENGTLFVMDHMLKTLSTLSMELHDYIYSHDLNQKIIIKTTDIQRSWIKAVRLFSGNEGILMEKFKNFSFEEPADFITNGDHEGDH